jgi:redox-sensitive bicupin YhaK (pirin superfamily)
MTLRSPASSSPVREVAPLGARWTTRDPFLFCVYHLDRYPKANDRFGPDAPLAGRDIGQDFAGIDGWRMYHGQTVPGFPQHPHRGFETVTIVRRGFIDHSDSLGAAARFGEGDVQWLTAGEGVVHSEMFPLFDREKSNVLELFQIWLNLPSRDKLAPPHFTMFWSGDIPRHVHTDVAGKRTEIVVIAGALEGVKPLAPPPHSWASRADNDVAIWAITLEPGATWTLPPARDPRTVRTLYFFNGRGVLVGDRVLKSHAEIDVAPGEPVALEAIDGPAEIMVLQGRPIAEPVAQYGPFVMNTRQELQQAFTDYQRTQFGGWPWPVDDPVHGRDPARFARYPDGRTERAPG